MWVWLIGSVMFLSVEDWRECRVTVRKFVICGLPMLIWQPSFSFWTLFLVAIGIFSEFRAIGMGSADFYLLAWWSGYFSIFELVKVVMIASLVGIFLGLTKFRGKQIPFFPCLAVGLVFVLGIRMFFSSV